MSIQKIGVGIAATVTLIFLFFCERFFFSFMDWSALPFWDEASHAGMGMIFAQYLREFNILGFLYEVYFENGLWPPLYGILQMPIYLVAGYEFELGRILSRLFFIGATFFVFFFALTVNQGLAFVAATLASICFMASPMLQSLVGFTMLEIPGCFFCLLVSWFYIRAIEKPTTKRFRIAFLSGALLFLFKYNYAILLLVPIALFEYGLDWKSRLPFKGLTNIFRRDDTRRPFFWVILSYVIFLAYIQFFGGMQGVVFGKPVFIRHIRGNPTFILFAFIGIYLGLYKREALQIYWREHCSDRLKLFTKWVVVPIALWLVNPLNFRNFFSHSINHSFNSSLNFIERISFYPKSIVQAYHPEPYLGIIMFVAACFSIILWQKAPVRARFFMVVTIFGLFAGTVHHHKSGRNIATILPFFWIAAAYTIVRIEETLQRYKATCFALMLAPIVLVGFALRQGWAQSEKMVEEIEYHSNADKKEVLLPALDCVCNFSNDVKETYIIGIWNRMSLALVNQHCLSQGLKLDDLPESISFSRFQYSLNDWQRLKDQWQVEQLLIVSYTGDYKEEYTHKIGVFGPALESLVQSDVFEQRETVACGPSYQVSRYFLTSSDSGRK